MSEDEGRHPTLMPIQLAKGELVVFYTVTILSAEKDEVRIIESVSREQESSAAWRANMLRTLADTVELEGILNEEEE